LLLFLVIPPVGASSRDRAFYEAFTQDGIAEIDAANLALQKSSNAMVKEFAAMMIKDHTSANERVEVLAALKTTPLPSAADQAVQAKLSSLSDRILLLTNAIPTAIDARGTNMYRQRGVYSYIGRHARPPAGT